MATPTCDRCKSPLLREDAKGGTGKYEFGGFRISISGVSDSAYGATDKKLCRQCVVTTVERGRYE